jgi:hypothetical protein
MDRKVPLIPPVEVICGQTGFLPVARSRCLVVETGENEATAEDWGAGICRPTRRTRVFSGQQTAIDAHRSYLQRNPGGVPAAAALAIEWSEPIDELDRGWKR